MSSKGKTWGPSTVHQNKRERVNLPELKQSQKLPSFFKSAPNLEKTRNLRSTNALHQELGKSEEALNRSQYTQHDDYPRIGCFSMFTRTDDAVHNKNTTGKTKKFSLDNDVPHNNNSLTCRGLKGSYSFDEESSNNNDGRKKMHNNNWRLQKSCDQLEDISSNFEKKCKVNSSKSSDDIYSSSQFNDDDFFNDIKSCNDSSDNLHRDDYSSKSSRLDDSMSSETGNVDNDFFKLGLPRGPFSSRGGSARKNSVTFVDRIETHVESLSLTEGSNRERIQTPPPQYPTATYDSSADMSNGNKKNSKHRSFKSSLSRIFKKGKGKRVKYSDSFRKTREKSEMNEKLLQSDPYDPVYTFHGTDYDKRS